MSIRPHVLCVIGWQPFLLIPLHVCLQPFSCFPPQYVIQEVRIMWHSCGQLSTEWLDYVFKGDRYCHLKLSYWPDYMNIEVLGLTIENSNTCTEVGWLVIEVRARSWLLQRHFLQLSNHSVWSIATIVFRCLKNHTSIVRMNKVSKVDICKKLAYPLINVNWLNSKKKFWTIGGVSSVSFWVQNVD